MKLLGKCALVTGAARGIGRGCALELARAGADVAINDREVSADAEETLAQIRGCGRKAVLVAGDIFQRANCQQVVQQAVAQLGALDILVSNPAYSRRGDFLTYDPQLFEQTLQGTLTAGFHIGQLAAQQMVHQGRGGKLVFISSVQSRIPFVGSVAYNAAKAGLNHMAATIAAELVRHRINVNVIEPGWTDTPGEHATFGSEAIAQAAPNLPWGRLATPADIGKACLFLCSDDANYITGTTLLVDGGFALRGAIGS